MPAFDPYYKWLGIPPEEQPPDHYRLLGVRRLENDREVIESLADQRMESIRKFQTGPHAVASQQLLSELAKARRCLLDPQRKAAYDASLTASSSSVTATVSVTDTAPEPVVIDQSAATVMPPEILETPPKAARSKMGPVLILSLAAMTPTLIGLIVWFALYGTGKKDKPDRTATATATSSQENSTKSTGKKNTSEEVASKEPEKNQGGGFGAKNKKSVKAVEPPPPPPIDPKERQQQLAKVHGWPVQLDGLDGQQFVMIPEGTVEIQQGRARRAVVMPKPIYFGKTEITQRQWTSLMKTTPWAGCPDVTANDTFPAVCISETDARDYCRRLSARLQSVLPEGLKQGCARLPTREEREFARRAFDASPQLDYVAQAGVTKLNLRPRRYVSSNSPIEMVGSESPNPFGLMGLDSNATEMIVDLNSGPVASLVSPTVGFRVVWDPQGKLEPADSTTPPLMTRHTAAEALIAAQSTMPVPETSLRGKLVVIPAGTNEIYSDQGQTKRWTISHPFFLSATEVTQRDWREVMQTQPWRKRPDVIEGDDSPAVFVSREDVLEFCDRLTILDRERKKIAPDARYRLPTEAEWEHAVRSGGSGRWFFGDSETALETYAQTSNVGPRDGQPIAVGRKLPNAWGLHDVYGNVTEWCLDGGASTFDANGINPFRPCDTGETVGVVRGGSFFDRTQSNECTSAGREVIERQKAAAWIGFRVLLDPSPQATSAGRSPSPRPLWSPGAVPPPLTAPFTPHQAQMAQLQWSQVLGRPVVEENPYGIRMVLIPPGEFGFGVDTSERRIYAGGRDTSIEHEMNQRPATIARPIWLSETELTKAQLKQILDRNPPFKTRAEARGDVKHAWSSVTKKFSSRGDWNSPGFDQPTMEHPAVMISRKDVEELCRLLTESAALNTSNTKGKPLRYRFPMEVEWEYACRGGTQTPFWFGDTSQKLAVYANGLSGQLQPDGSPPSDEPDGYVFTAPCASYPPNSFGLFDMSGNVWEWCQIRQSANANRVEFAVRGGGFINTPSAHYLRSAHRAFVEGTDGWAFLGVRLAADVEY